MTDDRRERPGYLAKKPIRWTKIPCKISRRDAKDGNEGMPKILRSNHHLYERLQEYREDRWSKLVTIFEANPLEFYNAYQWLNEHPVFYTFPDRGGLPTERHERNLQHDRGVYEGLEFTVVRVDPVTDAVSEDPARNTQLQFWYEFMLGQFDSPFRLHDTDLDGGATTYEVAVVRAALVLHDVYGNDRRKLDKAERKRAGE